MKKRFFVTVKIILVIFTTTILTTGCDSLYKKTNSLYKTGEISGEISVAATNESADALSEIAKSFMNKNPKTKVNINYVDTEYTQLMPKLSSGIGAPDIVQIEQKDFPSFLNKLPGKFEDLTELFKPYKERGDFVKATWTQATLKEEKIYGAPWYIGPSALYYRKDMFEEAGIDPNSINTWDDYIKAGKKITKHYNGKVNMLGFSYNDGYEFTMMLINQLGGDYFNDDGSVNLNNAKIVKALEVEKRMLEEGIVLDIPKEWNDRITALQNNKLATVPHGLWYANTITSYLKDQSGKWGIIELPGFEEEGNRSANIGGAVLAITKNTKNKSLSEEFLKYVIMSDEGNKINMKYFLFPAYKPSYKEEIIKEKNPYFDKALGEVFIQVSNIPNQNYNKHFNTVEKYFKESLQDIRIKKSDIGKTLDTYTEKANKEIKN